MATLLQNTPSGTDTLDHMNSGDQAPLEPGEEPCSPEEELALKKVMAVVYHSINQPAARRSMETWFVKSPHIGLTIGGLAFNLLYTAYKSAQGAGAALPATVFLAQGGAVYQTIDLLLSIAEHSTHVAIDPDKVREDALGYVLQKVKGMEKELAAPALSHAQPGSGQQPMQVAAAHPLSHAIGQGLMAQGMGAQS